MFSKTSFTQGLKVLSCFFAKENVKNTVWKGRTVILNIVKAAVINAADL
jgi:hypothetical protein